MFQVSALDPWSPRQRNCRDVSVMAAQLCLDLARVHPPRTSYYIIFYEKILEVVVHRVYKGGLEIIIIFWQFITRRYLTI